ncbi:YveK family protein [Negativibacillus massiliensis]|uniref:YveK family protein n=1 Tax=Negativibacillus massiliensis TaxID=1871035 RepID=UPI000335C540|nr:Wzz/FepE/Etk N-terminal domain-containing protein [Negativibacillus massiliensis]CDA77079.1 putative uncharacterized protein [Clostridium sp. CAG:242]
MQNTPMETPMETSMQEGIRFDLMELTQILFQHWIWIAATTVLCAAAGLLFTIFGMTPQYQAEATMIVNNRQDQTVSITNDQLVSAQKLVDTYSIIITNRGVIEPIMKNLNIEEDYEDFIENISVKALNNTQVMSIKVKNPDPQVALEIVTQIVERVPEVITSTIEAGSVNIVSAPYVNVERPVSPSKVKNTIFAAGAGFVLSVAAIFLIALLDNTFKSEEDIEKQLGLVTIGIIPTTESCRKKG